MNVLNSGMSNVTSKPTSCSCSFILFATSGVSLAENPNLICLFGSWLIWFLTSCVFVL
ncbi:hypothetical protein ['Chrysanthemum coronarium' phytoplasma]|uniref:hypothetical protein n=1 Tax='Chrysanthemum coronarium' phytoplasma TaxID=1520703 RepID=UPI00155A1A86|nr:hypothetical protein ['Chrysanthemum coronarium' phytoplasma]